MSTSPERCLLPAELTQAAAGAAAVEVRHLHACGACSAGVRDERRTERLVRSLPDVAVDELRLARVKAAVLAASVAPSPAPSTGPRARRRSRAILAAAAAVAAAALFATLRPRPEPSPPRARIIAVSSSSYLHQVAADRDELHLREGTLVIDVFPGHPLRVTTDDATLHIVDATFRIAATTDSLRSLEVYRGYVTIDSPRLGHLVLHPGTTLPSPSSPPALPPSPPPSPSSPPSPSPPPSPSLAPPRPRILSEDRREAPTESKGAEPAPRFRRGRALLAAGDLAEAAAAFEASAADPAESFLREEAQFWSAVAWGRADRRRAAIAGFRDFLDRYPASFRAGEARVALGALLVRAGDPAGARAAFEAAADDPDPNIARAARRGLAAVTAPR